VTSAYKLSKKEEDEIIKDLSDKYKTTVSIDIEIDENLVGGVVIKEGDKMHPPLKHPSSLHEIHSAEQFQKLH
jgi:hypothetical protein